MKEDKQLLKTHESNLVVTSSWRYISEVTPTLKQLMTLILTARGSEPTDKHRRENTQQEVSYENTR